jgi:drug/metabolite transporter (DMT)-like permease
MSRPSRPDPGPPATTGRGSLWLAFMPGLFVVLWSTGFIGARYGMPHAEPMTFLAIRFALTAAILGPIALLGRAPWPRRGRDLLHLAVAGLLVHAAYLGGVFVAIRLGLEAGLSAMIVSLQPLLVAASAPFLLGERVGRTTWAGLALGLLGVVLVLARKLGLGSDDGWAVLACLGALAGITAGTLYQKRFCSGLDLRSGNFVQFAASAAACWLLALLFETREVAWTGELVFALLWLVLVLSLGAISLLYLLLRHGAASQVASLFFLVPPTTALIAWPLFGERLGPPELLGMALTVTGVALANRGRRP